MATTHWLSSLSLRSYTTSTHIAMAHHVTWPQLLSREEFSLGTAPSLPALRGEWIAPPLDYTVMRDVATTVTASSGILPASHMLFCGQS
jgi:hypothetical protein